MLNRYPTLRLIILYILLFLAIALYKHERRTDLEKRDSAQEMFCANVETGLWLDYDGAYRKLCKPNR